MKKLITSVLLLIVLILTGCDAANPQWITNAPASPINVTGIVTGAITGSVSVTQNVTLDGHNSSTTNLLAGATFTGTATSTLGVSGIQVTIKADQNCTVIVEQSPDGINWDIPFTHNYIASLSGKAWNDNAVSAYLRVRVTNNGSVATTTFRLYTFLCPILEALPPSVDINGRLMTAATIQDQLGFSSLDTPTGEMRVIEPVKLVGSTFIGTTFDTNFWQRYSVGSGNVTQGSGNMVLTTGVTANSTSSVSSIRRGRYVAGSSMRYRAILMQGASIANNVRRWGVTDWVPTFAVTDGAYYKINGTTFGIAYMAGSMEYDVISGSFNGYYGSTYTIDSNYHVYEIYWTNTKIYYVIDGIILHTVTAANYNWTNTPTLYLWADNKNINGLATNVTETIKVASIYRLGPLQTAPIYKHITTTTTTVCKYGAGTLHSIIVNNPVNSTITVYDNTAGSGNVIAVISSLANTQPFTLPYNLDFYGGLTVVTAGNFDITVIYE